jgi:alpha-mannosidase
MRTKGMFQILRRFGGPFGLYVLVVAMGMSISEAQPPATSTTPSQTQTTTPDTNSVQQWPADAADLKLHMIGNAHIDAPWLWPLAESNAIVHSTFRSALDRLKEDPQLTMTTSSSQFYEWVENGDPAMLDEIRKRVQEGRWDLVGGWWVEPDVNIPNGEALIRQGLYGQRSLKRLFGRTATVGFNPDSFGHTGSIPQILKLQGMPNYVFMRPNATEKQLPSSLFWWQGIDGTNALTFRIPLAYDDPGDVRNHMLREIELLRGQSVRDDMEFFGIGDHGGGPTKANISSIHRIQGEQGAPKLHFSTPDRYFSEIRNSSFLNSLPVVTGDMQHHAVGCYTAGSDLKKLNRSTEMSLVTAEKIASIGSAAWGASYPKEDFTKAWKRVLLLQFHDSLGATTLPSYFDAAKNGYARAQDVATDAMYLAAQKLAWQVPTVDPDSKYLVVFNPHAWTTNLRIEYDLGWDPKKPTLLEDERGTSIPYQWIDATTTVTNRIGLAAEVQVPAMGYRQIRLHAVPATVAQPESTLRVNENEIENAHLKLRFLPDGTIGLLDKDSQKEVVRAVDGRSAGGMRAVVLDDPSDTWSHHVRAYDRVVGNFSLQSVKIVERGPVRARVRAQYAYGASRMTADYLLYANSRDVEVRVALDWHEQHKMLKFAFPVNVEEPKATYEVAYGAMERGTDGDEDPGQRWIDVSGRSGDQSYGLAVVNDAKYGYSVAGSEMSVSVVRSPVYAHHEPRTLDAGTDYQWMDQGVQHIRMLLIPHAGSWQQADLSRSAEKLVTEVPIVYQGIHPGTRAQSDSFLEVDAPDVIVSAVKQSEEGSDLIVRAYESTGVAKRTRIDLRFAHTTWTGDFRPYEIKTLRINPRTRRVSEVNALEE